MPHILHLDASARPGLAGKDLHGSHSRHLSQHFVGQWRARRPQDSLTYRDIGQTPPSIINHDWIASSFTPKAQREPWMHTTLIESDQLVDELIAADVLVIGAPLYNFGIPSTLKAYFDHIARAGVTFRYTAAGAEGLVKGKQVLVGSNADGNFEIFLARRGAGGGDRCTARARARRRYILGACVLWFVAGRRLCGGTVRAALPPPVKRSH